MKKKRYLLLTVLLLFSLTGCQIGGSLLEKVQGKEEQTTEKEKSEEKPAKKKSKKADKSTEDENEDKEDTAGEKAKTEKPVRTAPEVYILQNYDNDWNGHVTLMEVVYDTLEIEGEAGSGFEALLAQYNEEAAAQAKEWKETNRSSAEDMYNWNSSSFFSYEYEQEIQIHRADEQVLSFDTMIYEYTGGPHGYSYFVGKTYDVFTGRELSLEDVVTDTSKLPEVILKELQKKYPEETFFDGYEDVIAGQFDSDSADAAYTPPCWMLDNGGLVFYYAQYELASYSAGMLEVFLPFSEYPDLVKPLYQVEADECALPMKLYQTQYFDLDGDGTVEEIYLGMYQTTGYGGAQVHIYVNGEDSVYYPMDECWFDTAYLMKMKDGTCYLYVSVGEVDDMYEILVFYLGGRGAVYEDSYWGAIDNNIFMTPGRFKISSYLDILGTYSGYKYYYVDNEGMPRTDDRAYTIINYTYGDEPERCLTAKIPVSVWMVLGDGSMADSPEELPVGTKFYFRKTDGRSYVEMELEDGRRCQIRVDITSWPRTVGGVDENDCFDGIIYAG